jgi:hypothetical protein
VRDRLQVVPFSVAAGQHTDDAGHPLCRSGIDARDPRMRVRRPDDMDIALALEAHVIGKPPPAGQQTRILAPPDRLADALRPANYRIMEHATRLRGDWLSADGVARSPKFEFSPLQR